MKLLYNPAAYTVHSDSGSAPNYPAANVASPSVARYWQAGSTAGSWMILDKGASGPTHLAVQHVPFSTFGAFQAGGNPAFLLPTPGSLVLHTDGSGRRKGSVSFASNVPRYLRLELGAANPAVQIGALYIFTAVQTLPDALLRSEITTEYPQASVKLPNGTEFPVDRGPPRTRITLRWRRPRTDDIEEVARIARAGICWLDLQNPDQPGWQWPVRCISATFPRQLTHARQDEATLEFVEVV